MRFGIRRLLVLQAAALVLLAGSIGAQTTPADPARLSVDRIFASREFAPERFGPARWMSDGDSYTTLEPSAAGGGGAQSRPLSGRVRPARGARAGGQAGAAGRLRADRHRRLRLVARRQGPDRDDQRAPRLAPEHARRLLDVRTRVGPAPQTRPRLRPVDAHVREALARRPDGRLRGEGQYLRGGPRQQAGARQLTSDGSDDIINGTSDWVNEEEFGIRDGFRWSPDSRLIAFWQFDTHGVPVFTMINNTDAVYPTTGFFLQAPEGRSAELGRPRRRRARLGRGPVVWMKTQGDPHDLYIPLMDWAGNAKEVVFQQLNRLQNTNAVQLGDAATGNIRTMFVDKDEAWLDHMDSFAWLAGGKGLFWLSERDGWRHAYYVSRDGAEVRLMTPGDYDVMSVDAIDERAGMLYVTASPDNATTRLPVPRCAWTEPGKPERVGPAGQTGVHRYDVSPDGPLGLSCVLDA